MNKRYQVFLSSTFRDLEEERLEVMRALLELDCFPCGMEYFPAANDDQWSFISELIDQCDYYIVVVGNRYGSTDENGISYTEKEYRYAIEKGIPIIGFLHSDPASIPNGKSDRESAAIKKLETFRALVQTRLCKEWTSAADLGAVVSRSLTQLIRRNPRPGWVRANHLASAEASEEILRLRNQIDDLKHELEAAAVSKPQGSEALAQGDEEISIEFTLTFTDRSRPYPYQHERYARVEIFTWSTLLRIFGPYFLTESKLANLKSAINRTLKDRAAETSEAEFPDLHLGAASISESSLQIITVQFVALGYIKLNMEKDDSSKEVRLAELTPLGRQQLMTVTAVKSINSTSAIDG